MIRADKDKSLLELFAKLRPQMHCADLGDGPRVPALQGLRTSIDRVVEVVTGDREYSYGKHHSIG
ncbi:hypothetical protein [Bradyrhizobium liaoningense]